MEQPLGKAEWIKLYGACLVKEKRPQYCLMELSSYNDAKQLVASQNQQQPFYTALYQDQWYVARKTPEFIRGYQCLWNVPEDGSGLCWRYGKRRKYGLQGFF
jgi:hypothetical protein